MKRSYSIVVQMLDVPSVCGQQPDMLRLHRLGPSPKPDKLPVSGRHDVHACPCVASYLCIAGPRFGLKLVAAVHPAEPG